MAENESIPYYAPAEQITVQAEAAVVGKTFVDISGDRTSGPGLSATTEGGLYQVSTCAAGEKAVGVATRDAALGENLKIHVGGGAYIVPVTAGATITAGDEVEVNGAGRAIPLASGIAVGKAMTGATSGNDAEIRLY